MKKRVLSFALLLLLGGNVMSLDMKEYREGFKRGWASSFEQKGNSVPSAPSVKSPSSKRSGDKRTDYERGYMEGLNEAQQRFLR